MDPGFFADPDSGLGIKSHPDPDKRTRIRNTAFYSVEYLNGYFTVFLKSSTFCLHFIHLQFTCVVPDAYLEYGSGSKKVLNTDPIRIRIHNTE